MKRALITGGAGLIGSYTADLLLNESCDEIVILDNLVRGRRENIANVLASGKADLVVGDIGDRALLARLMQGVDVVFHMAALRITQCAEQPRLAMDSLVNGTYNVLEAAVAAKVKRVVAASTASVYGMAESFPTTERHHPYNNRTLYGAAKSFNESLLRSFNEMYGLDYVALRYFNVYGPRMDIHGIYTEVLIRWMEQIDAGKPPKIFGDGRQTMDFIYVEDVARANVLAAKSRATDEVFNVASGAETSLNDLARALLHVMGSDLKPQYGPERGVNPVKRRLASTARAEEALGFKASISIEEGLDRLVRWWRQEQLAHV